MNAILDFQAKSYFFKYQPPNLYAALSRDLRETNKCDPYRYYIEVLFLTVHSNIIFIMYDRVFSLIGI